MTSPKITQEQIQRARRLIDTHEKELTALLDYCNSRGTRDEGVPAILIVDDINQIPKLEMIPALTDEALGPYFADLSFALALLVEANGGDPDYPSICPAMSAIAEQAFGTVPFCEWKTGMEGG
jgi:hypothetical protein